MEQDRMQGRGRGIGSKPRPPNYENFKVSKRRMTKLHRFLTKSLFGKTLDERHGNDGWNRMECRGGDEESDRGPLNGKVCGGKGRGRAVSRAGRIVIIQHVCTCARTTTGEYRLEVAIPS